MTDILYGEVAWAEGLAGGEHQGVCDHCGRGIYSLGLAHFMCERCAHGPVETDPNRAGWFIMRKDGDPLGPWGVLEWAESFRDLNLPGTPIEWKEKP